VTKSPSKLDWIIAEDEEVWRASQSAAQTPAVSKALRRKEAMLATLIATLVLLAGGWLWYRQAATKSPANDLQSSLLQTGHPLTSTLALPGDAIEGKVLQRSGNRMMAQVTVQYPEDGTMRAYRETRFYEKVVGEWRRIPPDPALLGEQKTLKVANFAFVYRAMDADTVYAVVPMVEKRYAGLRRDFGLPLADATSNYTIEVTAGDLPSPEYDSLRRKLTVSSTTMLSAQV
jgi:hypothetical protein